MDKNSFDVVEVSVIGAIINIINCYHFRKPAVHHVTEMLFDVFAGKRSLESVDGIAFSDELLMSSRDRTLQLCDAFIDAGLNIKWDCNGRLNFADIDVLEKMKKVGCVFINYGIESLDDETLRVMQYRLWKYQ